MSGCQVLTDDPDFLRDLVTHVVQEILEAEMTTHLGAASYERTESRTGQRNGYKPRQLQTRVGTLTLMVPQDRAGTFSTQLFARYQRTEKALVLSLMEMYLQGVSTRKVRAITEALCGTAFSKSQVSRLASTLDGDLAGWRGRSLADHGYPYLVVDARYEHVRAGGQVMTQGVLIVSGVRDDGKRAILAVEVADTESAATHMAVFRDLKARGLRGVRLVTSDDHAGLRAAIERYFQGAGWQRCQVHYTRNLVGMVGVSKRKALVAGGPLGSMRALFTATTPTQARAIADHAALKGSRRLLARHPSGGRTLPRRGERSVFRLSRLPAHASGADSHHERLGAAEPGTQTADTGDSGCPLGRFPNREACLRLVTALCAEQSEEWESGWQYLDMSELPPVFRQEAPMTLVG